MNSLLSVVVAVVASSGPRIARAAGASAGVPWKQNRPIVKVKKELHVKYPRPRAAAMAAMYYVGPKLERMEWRALEIRDDVPDTPKFRLSTDNGRTWSKFSPLPPTLSRPKGVEVWEGPNLGTMTFDPRTNVLVQVWLRQIQHKGEHNNFSYSRVSRDSGRTWSAPKQMRYEDGDPFDPGNPLKSSFLKRNRAYFGNNILLHGNGTLIHTVAATNVPEGVSIPNPNRVKAYGVQPDSRAIASLCFVGKWDAKANDYRWKAGKPVWLPRDVSSRGLMEPESAELRDGRVLVIWRGSNAGLDASKQPGRKWFSVSTDGGMTLSPVAELEYDDGSRFYSPSSIHRMIRHSVTGKLYWLGNISPRPTSGNSPRYPLIIAEVDEKIPALKRKTVTVIDDRKPGQTAGVQFSNFSLLEDRQKHHFEVYLTAYGENADSVYSASSYKYTLTLDR